MQPLCDSLQEWGLGRPHAIRDPWSRRSQRPREPNELAGWLCTSLYTHAPMSGTVKAAVAGANGYAGMTLVSLLARHPGVELAPLTSRSFAGKRYSDVFPLLDLKGEFLPEPDAKGLDVVFSCLPHNVGASKAAG